MIQISVIPQEFITAYNIKDKVHNGYIFEQVTKGIYGFPQAGQIAHDFLVKKLSPYVHHTSRKNPVIWTHNSRPINFTSVVDDFSVKYSGKEHALHLKALIEEKYSVSVYRERKMYIVISLSGNMKKSRSNYPCQDIYVQHYIHYNMRNQNEHKIHHPLDPYNIWKE